MGLARVREDEALKFRGGDFKTVCVGWFAESVLAAAVLPLIMEVLKKEGESRIAKKSKGNWLNLWIRFLSELIRQPMSLV